MSWQVCSLQRQVAFFLMLHFFLERVEPCRSIVEMTFCPKSTDLYSSPKERHLLKSCVSFGEECRTENFCAQKFSQTSLENFLLFNIKYRCLYQVFVKISCREIASPSKLRILCVMKIFMFYSTYTYRKGFTPVTDNQVSLQ